MEKKIIYSYQSLIRDILESKNKKKVKEKSFEPDIDVKDFTTNKKLNLDNWILNNKNWYKTEYWIKKI